MEVIGGVGSILGIVGGVAALASTLNTMKERYTYAALNITLVSSSLLTVKAALEAIHKWRSSTTTLGSSSQQLDQDLSITIESCAVLISVIERKLGETELAKPTVYDKVRFVHLDSVFKDFALNLDSQVRALQLLLTIYQWWAFPLRCLLRLLTLRSQTLTERNEKLQRRDTRKVFRAVRQSTASLNYEDQDIEDAASILSEDPSVSFDVDPIILMSKVYRKYHPERYRHLMQNFPSRTSTISTVQPAKPPRHLAEINQDTDPIIANNVSLPFLGIPYQGETTAFEKSEPQNNSEDDSGIKERETTEASRESPSTMARALHEASKSSNREDLNLSTAGHEDITSNTENLQGELGVTVGDNSLASSEVLVQREGQNPERLPQSTASNPLSSFEQRSGPRSPPDLTEFAGLNEPEHHSERSSVHSWHPSDISDLFGSDNEDSKPREKQQSLRNPSPPALSAPNTETHQAREITPPNPSTGASQDEKTTEIGKSPALGTSTLLAPSLDADVQALKTSKNFPSLDIDFGSGPFLQINSDVLGIASSPSKAGDRYEYRDPSLPERTIGSGYVTTANFEGDSRFEKPSASADPVVRALNSEYTTGQSPSIETQKTASGENNSRSSPAVAYGTEKRSETIDQTEDRSGSSHAPDIQVAGEESDTQFKPGHHDKNLSGNFAKVVSVETIRPMSEGSPTTKTSLNVVRRPVSTSSLPNIAQHDQAPYEPSQPRLLPSRAATVKAPSRPPPQPSTLPSPKRPPPPIPLNGSRRLSSIPLPDIKDTESQSPELEFTSGLARNKLPSSPYGSISASYPSQEGATIDETMPDIALSLQPSNTPQSPRVVNNVVSRSRYDYAIGAPSGNSISLDDPRKPSGSPSIKSEMNESIASSVSSSTAERGTHFTRATLDSENTAPTADSVHHTEPLSANQVADPKKLAISNSLQNFGEQNKAEKGATRLFKIPSRMKLPSFGEKSSKVIRIAEAVDPGNLALLRAALQAVDKKSDVQVAVTLGAEKIPRTPLMRAASRGYIACMEELSAYEVDGSATDKIGRTAMHYALAAGIPEAAQWLLYYQRGQVHGRPPNPRTVTATDLIMTKDKDGIAPIHLAATLEQSETLAAFIEAGADVTLRDLAGSTPLHFAARKQRLECTKLLASKMEKVDEVDRNGVTALMVAARANALDLVNCLLNGGANKYKKDPNGDQAIHHAARHGKLPALEALYLSPADLEVKNNRGERPIHLACAEGHPHIVRALARAGCQINPFTEPPHAKLNLKFNRENMAEVSMNLASTPLHYACACGLYDIAEILLDHGGMVNANQEDGTSPLMLACNSESPGLTQLLLKKGANPNSATSEERMTALHIAARRNGLETTKLLVDYGADTKAKLNNKWQHTPTGYALYENPSNKRDAANYLLSINFRPTTLNHTQSANRTSNSSQQPQASAYAAPYTVPTEAGIGYDFVNFVNRASQNMRIGQPGPQGYFAPTGATAIAPPSYAESEAQARENTRDRSKFS